MSLTGSSQPPLGRDPLDWAMLILLACIVAIVLLAAAGCVNPERAMRKAWEGKVADIALDVYQERDALSKLERDAAKAEKVREVMAAAPGWLVENVEELAVGGGALGVLGAGVAVWRKRRKERKNAESQTE